MSKKNGKPAASDAALVRIGTRLRRHDVRDPHLEPGERLLLDFAAAPRDGDAVLVRRGGVLEIDQAWVTPGRPDDQVVAVVLGLPPTPDLPVIETAEGRRIVEAGCLMLLLALRAGDPAWPTALLQARRRTMLLEARRRLPALAPATTDPDTLRKIFAWCDVVVGETLYGSDAQWILDDYRAVAQETDLALAGLVDADLPATEVDAPPA